MGKTTYVDGNPAEGVPGTIVTADFLNKVNNHYHTGRDVDGEGALAYAADSGAADAYVVTLSPALDEYITGMPITFKAANANTGASTIDVNELGAKTIKKNGSEDLAVGDILAGQIVTVIYDGTNFQLMAAPRVLALRDAARGLVVKNNTSNPNHQVDISADEIILQDSSGNPMRVLNLSMTADMTVSGAGGLDTGSEAASTWYHLWVIAKADGTKSVIFSTSATAPTLPTGYTYKAYTGAWYNGADGHLRKACQIGRRVTMEGMTADMLGGTATSYTAVTISVPTTARIWHGCLGLTANSGMGSILLASDSSWAGNCSQIGWAGSSVLHQAMHSMIIKTPQTLYYALQGSPYVTLAGSLWTSGWEY